MKKEGTEVKKIRDRGGKGGTEKGKEGQSKKENGEKKGQRKKKRDI